MPHLIAAAAAITTAGAASLFLEHIAISRLEPWPERPVSGRRNDRKDRTSAELLLYVDALMLISSTALL